jgi:hypothetical protein
MLCACPRRQEVAVGRDAPRPHLHAAEELEGGVADREDVSVRQRDRLVAGLELALVQHLCHRCQAQSAVR